MKSKSYEEERIRRIKREYGADAFRKWGVRGGNPVLLAQGRGDKIIIRKRKPR